MQSAVSSPYDTQKFAEEVREAADFVRGVLGEAEVALVLGSGLNGFIDKLEDRKELPYAEIPHMPTTTVKGHFGRLASGTIGGLRIFCLAGRSHAYEGKPMYQLTFTTRLMHALGCRILIATNASGGCGAGMVPGCLMVITDHINLFHRSPLAETFEDRALGARRVDLTNAYSPRLREKALRTAEKLNLKLWEGVYCSVCGPCYETPTEVLSGRAMGVSAFGMSTIPEVVAARSLGMEVFAMSLITNLAAGMAAETITHSHVQMVADVAGPGFVNFVQEFIRDIKHEPQPEASYNAVGFLRPAHEDPKASRAAALPQPIAPPATGAQINAAADFVLTHGAGENGSLADVALYLAPSHGAGLVKRLHDARTIAYRDIPHFPSISPSSRRGELVVGALTVGGPRLAVLHKNVLEGLSCEESVFMARLLRVLGVATLVHTFLVERRGGDEAPKVGNVAVLTDALDFTTIHPWTHNKPFQPLHAVSLFNAQPLRAAAAKAFEAQGVTTSESTYMAFQGPSLPSGAEVAIGRQLGCQLVGTASLGLVYAARSNGLGVVGLAQPADFHHQHVLPKAHVGRALEALLAAHPPVAGRPQREADALPASVYTVQQVTPHLARPVSQGVFEHVEEAAAHVRAAVSGEPALALVVEDEALYTPLATHFKQLTAIPNIPHMPLGVELLCGELKEQTDAGLPVVAFVVKGIHYMAEGRPFIDISFPMRVLRALGVGRVVLVGRSAACSPAHAAGDVVIVNDHVNFSGRNPLFGPNDDRWGVRFPDMSNAYEAAIRSLAHDEAEAAGIAVKRAIVGLFVGPAFVSGLDAALARLGGAEVVAVGLMAPVVVARHAGMKVGVISVVSGQVHDINATTTTSAEEEDARLVRAADEAARLVARLAARLATAGPHHDLSPNHDETTVH